MYIITNGALSRTLIGSGLKLIGAMARIGDIPQQYPDLREKAIQRELSVVGIIFLADRKSTRLN